MRVPATAGKPDASEADAAPAPPRALRPAGWALGLPALALLVVVAGLRFAPAIEINIRREAARIARGEPDSALGRAGARVEVAGRDVRVVTDANLADKVWGEVETRIAAVPAVRSVAAEATGFVSLSPFPFAARRTTSGIELSGAVPTAALRDRLVALAGRIVPPDQVEDRLRLAAGAPDGFEAVAVRLLSLLERADSVDVRTSDRRVDLSAQPRSPADYNRLMAEVRALPPGHTLGELDVLPPRVDPFVWTARRDAGGVALAGAVPSEAKRADLVRLASILLPGLPVRDAMQTARGLDRSVDLDAAARGAFEALARMTVGEAQVVGRRFTIDGEAVARSAPDAIMAGLRASLPGALGTPSVDIRVVAASPYVFTARRADGRVEWSGFLPASEDRKALAGLMASRFPGERLVDRTVLADGAPAGFPEAARTSLEVLSDFAEGEAAIADRTLRYSGRVLYPQLAARLRRIAPAKAPDGWDARAEIETARAPGLLDASLCEDLLGDALRRNPLRFEPAKPVLASGAAPALEAAADILRRCGRLGVKVVHHMVSAEEDASVRDLAEDRAQLLATALRERGVVARFTTGATVSSGKGGERTEFQVTPLDGKAGG